MAKKKDAKYAVGYGKPPCHSRFKPGQSGNPHGRPKKADSVADVLQKELDKRIAIIKDGKRQRVSMLRAIIKQNLNKAANGDARATAILFDALKFYKPDAGDNLGALVQEFRAIHARHAASDHDQNGVAETDRSSQEKKSDNDA